MGIFLPAHPSNSPLHCWRRGPENIKRPNKVPSTPAPMGISCSSRCRHSHSPSTAASTMPPRFTAHLRAQGRLQSIAPHSAYGSSPATTCPPRLPTPKVWGLHTTRVRAYARQPPARHTPSNMLPGCPPTCVHNPGTKEQTYAPVQMQCLQLTIHARRGMSGSLQAILRQQGDAHRANSLAGCIREWHALGKTAMAR